MQMDDQNTIDDNQNNQDRRDRKTGRIQLVLIIVFVVMSFVISSGLKIAYTDNNQSNPEEKIITVQAELISPQNHRVTFSETGIVSPQTEISIAPEVAGNVIMVNENFYTGGQFTAGEILFQIDPIDYQLDFQRAKAEVARAQTVLDLAQATSDSAIKEWKQFNGRAKPVPDLVAKTPQLDEAKSSLRAAQAQLRDAQLNLERTSYKVPFNGRVIESDIAVGKYVAAGQPYGTLYSIDDLEVKTALDRQRMAWLEQGQFDDIQLTITKDSVQIPYQGYLKRGASSLDSNTRLAPFSIGIRGNKNDLLPGYFVTLDITGPEFENMAIIPASAYQKDEQIWLVGDGNVIRPLTPDILYQTNDYIAVRNIDREIMVVTSKLPGAIEGMTINIMDNATDTVEAEVVE